MKRTHPNKNPQKTYSNVFLGPFNHTKIPKAIYFQPPSFSDKDHCIKIEVRLYVQQLTLSTVVKTLFLRKPATWLKYKIIEQYGRDQDELRQENKIV